MRKHVYFIGLMCSFSALAAAQAPLGAGQILARALDGDAFGLSTAHVKARVQLRDKRGSARELAFSSKAQRYDAQYAKSIVRFSAPSDLAGAGFLQIQKRDGDDERFLYLPELKRPRRIAGTSRASAFMGTDLSYADLDQRDFRDAGSTLKSPENVGKWPCFVLDVVPRTHDSAYSHVEMWIRQDNFVVMKMRLYDASKTLLKTYEALELKRIDGHWFVSRSRMTNNQNEHTTELILDQIEIKTVDDDEFSVRNLEKS
jgi:hypothetical protein